MTPAGRNITKVKQKLDRLMIIPLWVKKPKCNRDTITESFPSTAEFRYSWIQIRKPSGQVESQK
jgi:hypothetical protein